MNFTRSKLTLAVMAMGLLATGAMAQTTTSESTTRIAARSGGDFGFRHMLGFYTRNLDLTDAQQTQIKDIITREKPTIQPLMQQMASNRQQLQQLEGSGTFDEAKVRSVASQQAQTMTELIVQRERIKSEMMQVLTPDQKTKLAQLKTERQQKFHKHWQSQSPTQNQ
jgi:Spy/CpxP family protein refolding chaperone